MVRSDPARTAPAGAPTQTATRPRLPRPARRAQLLEAAQEIFVAQGYHAAGMDDIADRAGVSKPVLYQHFPGKLELYVALLDRHVDALVAQVRAALTSTTDNRERVHRCITAYFDFVGSDGGAYRLVFESDLRNEPAVRERIERALEQCVDAMAETIAADMGIAPEEARLLSVAVAGQAEMSARWWLSASETVSRERAVELLAGLVWRGLRGKPKDGSELRL